MAAEREFTFTLVLDGANPLTPEHQDALYEAGCGDATFSETQGVYHADFDRRAPSLAAALWSAIRTVESAVDALKVTRIEPDEYVSQADIARRLNYKPQVVSQYIHGLRGPGDFPPPSLNVRSRRPLWAFSRVARWFREKGHLPATQAQQLMNDTSLVATLNGLLTVRVHAPLLAQEQDREIVWQFLAEDQQLIQRASTLLEKSKS